MNYASFKGKCTYWIFYYQILYEIDIFIYVDAYRMYV